jgi:NhaP-type Na+/H+ or K+/H+ antiporter
MRLTWKDAVSTVFMAVIAGIYVAFLNSTSAWLISSARGTAGAVLVLGMVGGCGMSAAAQYQDRQGWAYLSLASVLGATALAAGVIALITASTVALAILVAATLVLWLAATVRHAFTPWPVSGGSRDTHEVIDPEKARH